MVGPLLNQREEVGITEFKQRVQAGFGDRATLFKMFGSKARGEAWEESDTDILVLIRDLNWQEKARIIDISSDINLEYDLMLSPLIMRPEEYDHLLRRERRLALDIEREGIPL